MLTLSYGFKKPQTGDINFFDELEGDIQQLNDHTHNGVDSSLLTPASLNAIAQTISSAGWATAVNGIYSQTVTMTSPYSYDNVIISFRITSDKSFIPLECVKVSSNSYTIYSNDNTLALTAYYK